MSNSLAETHATQADWGPRGAVRVQAWREANEIAGRTLMREGAWLV